MARPYLASAVRGAARWPWKWTWAWPRERRVLAGNLAIVMVMSFAFAALPLLAGDALLEQTQRSFLGDLLGRAAWLAGAAAVLLGAATGGSGGHPWS